MPEAELNTPSIRDNDRGLDSAAMPNWWRVSVSLQGLWKGLAESDPRRACIDNLLYEHLSAKVRMEQSTWFADVIQTLRLEKNVGGAVRRYFEAFVFLCRSALDCEACFINDLCQLGLSERVVDFGSVKKALVSRHKYKKLLSALARETDNAKGTWFWHFNLLRNSDTHRTVSASAVVYCVGRIPEYCKHDKYFLLEDPRDRKSFGKNADFGVGAYTANVLAKTAAAIEAAEGVLADYLKKGTVAP